MVMINKLSEPGEPGAPTPNDCWKAAVFYHNSNDAALFIRLPTFRIRFLSVGCQVQVALQPSCAARRFRDRFEIHWAAVRGESPFRTATRSPSIAR